MIGVQALEVDFVTVLGAQALRHEGNERLAGTVHLDNRAGPHAPHRGQVDDTGSALSFKHVRDKQVAQHERRVDVDLNLGGDVGHGAFCEVGCH